MDREASIFRALLIASIVMGIMGSVVDFMLPQLLPAPLREAQDALVAAELTALEMVVGIVFFPFLVALIVCTVGLYRFRAWAPRASLYLSVVALALYPPLGFVLVSGWGMFLTETGSVLWGGMLAMAFLPPVKDRFQKKPAGP